jgi:hypothetical protein
MGQYPEWMKKDMLEAQDAYTRGFMNHNLERGYRPYTGMTTAGFTPEQIASQQGLASLVGSQAPLQTRSSWFNQRSLLLSLLLNKLKSICLLILELRLMLKRQQHSVSLKVLNFLNLKQRLLAAGGMSGLGSRAGVQAAELQSGQNRLLADLEATGQQKAYQDAQNLFKSQKERERQSALAMQNLNKEIFTGGIKEQAFLDAIGTEKQKMAQTMLDEAQDKVL